MPKIAKKTITLYLTPNYNATNNVARIGRVKRCSSGFDMSEFNLQGKEVAKTKSLYTEDLHASLGGVYLGKQSNCLFNENSSIYDDAENTRQDVFNEVTKRVLKMVKDAKENIQVGLFGGWGYGCGKKDHEIERSHNLFNNVALCIENDLPENEGIKIPLLTIWGKLNSSKPDAIYARENSIVLINEIFRSLFKNGKCNMTQQELKDFLGKHYEEVLIPDNVVIVPEEKYQALNIQDNLKRKERLLNFTI